MDRSCRFLARTLRNSQITSVSWEKNVQDEIHCPGLQLDKHPPLDETARVHKKPAPLSWIIWIAAAILCIALSGCGALLLVGGAGTSAIAFATGELQSTEPHSLDLLDGACALALDEMAYNEIEVERTADQIRWRAKTSGGDPVDVQLHAKGPKATDLRIRIGVFGNESRSRLLLEQIHQAL